MKKNIILSLLILVFPSFTAFAQCETEPKIDSTGKVLKEIKQITRSPQNLTEYTLLINAKTNGSSWLCTKIAKNK
jgi:predicted S18 family serine protease